MSHSVLSPRGGLDFESRVRLAFEVIRRRILELPLSERVPFPFDYWAKMMSKVDSELENDVNFSIDEVCLQSQSDMPSHLKRLAY